MLGHAQIGIRENSLVTKEPQSAYLINTETVLAQIAGIERHAWNNQVTKKEHHLASQAALASQPVMGTEHC